MNRISYARATVLGYIGLFWTQPSAGACVGHMIVRPVGTITNLDPVRFEILVNTNSTPPTYEQSTELAIVGNEVSVRMWIIGGPLDMFDSLAERTTPQHRVRTTLAGGEPRYLDGFGAV